MIALVLALVIVALDVWAVYGLLTSSAGASTKVLWVSGILLFPLIGPLVWQCAGPKGESIANAFR